MAVNRYWALMFGRGLVETAMDFGAQGARPTHEALVDWMARDFVDNGWKADASAQSAAGTAGANVAAGFVNGIAIFQVTEGGLMANADISGTRYWKYQKLNK